MVVSMYCCTAFLFVLVGGYSHFSDRGYLNVLLQDRNAGHYAAAVGDEDA